MSNEIITVDADGVVQQAPITLFGTDDPAGIVARASTIATALADVIKRKRLSAKIGNREHVLIEGWTLLGSMLGVFAEVEWSKPLDGGYEARAVARTLAGRTVGAAEAMCTRFERTWKDRDDYAIRSMAQTRAVSKALRLPLGFIMELAGYSATPAEELSIEQPSQESMSRPPSAPAPRAAPAAVSYRREELAHLAHEKSLDGNALETYAAMVGIKKGDRASDAQMDALIAAIEGHGTEQVIDAPSPPKPGSDEYLALPAVEKSAAKAYWSAQA